MTHLEAFERTLTAVGRPMTTTHVALAELARTLAAQMDTADGEPSTRLSAAYLSVLKDIGRVQVAPAKQSEKAQRLAQLRGGRVTPLRPAADGR